MGDSQLPTSSSAREASTRGSAPEAGDGLTNTPQGPVVSILPLPHYVVSYISVSLVEI